MFHQNVTHETQRASGGRAGTISPSPRLKTNQKECSFYFVRTPQIHPFPDAPHHASYGLQCVTEPGDLLSPTGASSKRAARGGALRGDVQGLARSSVDLGQFSRRQTFAKCRVRQCPVIVAGETGNVPAAFLAALCLQLPSLAACQMLGAHARIQALKHLRARQ